MARDRGIIAGRRTAGIAGAATCAGSLRPNCAQRGGGWGCGRCGGKRACRWAGRRTGRTSRKSDARGGTAEWWAPTAAGAAACAGALRRALRAPRDGGWDFGRCGGGLVCLSSRIGRGGEIRTLDPYNPIVVRYQAALRPDTAKSLHCSGTTRRRLSGAGSAGPPPARAGPGARSGRKCWPPSAPARHPVAGGRHRW